MKVWWFNEPVLESRRNWNQYFFADNSTQQNSSMSIPEHVQGDLKKLAEWLMYHNFDSYMYMYGSLRSSILLRSVQALKDYQKANSLTMAASSPSSGSTTAVLSPSSPVMHVSMISSFVSWIHTVTSKYWTEWFLLSQRKGRLGADKKSRLSYAIEKRASKMLQKASAAMENSMGYGLGARKTGPFSHLTIH